MEHEFTILIQQEARCLQLELRRLEQRRPHVITPTTIQSKELSVKRLLEIMKRRQHAVIILLQQEAVCQVAQLCSQVAEDPQVAIWAEARVHLTVEEEDKKHINYKIPMSLTNVNSIGIFMK